ncbi:hypothetical protein KC358_g32 [Hortaea werneckii]|nr:hypothetical protein KC358_g32 [Hortaea werneckii]
MAAPNPFPSTVIWNVAHLRCCSINQIEIPGSPQVQESKISSRRSPAFAGKRSTFNIRSILVPIAAHVEERYRPQDGHQKEESERARKACCMLMTNGAL